MFIPPFNLNVSGNSGKDPLSGGPVKPPSNDGYDPTADLFNVLGSPPGSVKAPPSGEINPGNSKPGPNKGDEPSIQKLPPMPPWRTWDEIIKGQNDPKNIFGNNIAIMG